MVILLTGGAGFVGHHVADYILSNTEHELVLLDRLDHSGNLNRLTDLDCWATERHRARFVYHDLRAPVNEAIKALIGPVDWVIHIAAASHVDRSIDDPMSFVLDNVVGTVNLLNYCRETNPSKVLYFSTDEVFGPAPEGVRYDEWSRYKSGNPYAASKAGGEEMAVAFANTYRLPVMVTHTMNVFGERQHSEKFVPGTIRKVLNGETVTIHADRTKTIPGSRFYIHAKAVADAVMFVMNHGTPGEKYNIVGEREVDNLEMAQRIAATLNRPLGYTLTDFHSSRPGHDLRYALSGDKLAKMGWTPPGTFESNLEATVQWYRQHPNWLS